MNFDLVVFLMMPDGVRVECGVWNDEFWLCKVLISRGLLSLLCNSSLNNILSEFINQIQILFSLLFFGYGFFLNVYSRKKKKKTKNYEK